MLLVSSSDMSLFDHMGEPDSLRESLGPGATILRGFALRNDTILLGDTALLGAIRDVERDAPFRHWITPGGFRMSVAMTNCGQLGWVSDRRGYRYDSIDPESGKRWPVMPEVFRALAVSAANEAGFNAFDPDACLINRYEPGTKLSLHQDKDEHDYAQPIVSVSLGLPAVFLFGGDARNDEARRIALEHGDVVVWGGEARLRYHGVALLKKGSHPMTGSYRFNLTFRKAGR